MPTSAPQEHDYVPEYSFFLALLGNGTSEGKSSAMVNVLLSHSEMVNTVFRKANEPGSVPGMSQRFSSLTATTNPYLSSFQRRIPEN